MERQHAILIDAMTAYDHGDPERIQHFIKVHDFAATIGVLKGLDEEEQFILETAAIVHDIGIRNSVEKYHSSAGKYQEIEGPGEAEKLLCSIGGYTKEQIERVKYLVAHHHTYSGVEGMDYRILLEADFLVNHYENHDRYSDIQKAKEVIFRTEAGTRLLTTMFETEDNEA